jgi:hypothetical protein
MKKIVFVLLGVSALVIVLPSQASAAGLMNFYLRGGVLTDKNFSFDPFLWTAGANIDFNIGSTLILSPECDVIVYKFNFKPLWLAPAVLLNLNLGGFYLGGGLGKLLVIGSGYDLTSDFLLKFNAGIKSGGFKLQAYLWTPLGNEAFKDIAIGANLGLGF